jgi:hypothetical protein
MRRYVPFIFLFLACSWIDASSWDFDAGIGVGYRRDSQFFSSHLQSSPDILVYKEDNRDLQGVALDGFARLWLPYFLISIEGDYSWYLSGSLNNTSVILDADDPSALDVPTYFTYDNKGTAYDVYGMCGIVIPIPLTSSSALYLVPEAGYGIDQQSLRRSHQVPNPFLINGGGPGGSDLAFSNDLSKHPTERTWWGPFVGGELIVGSKQIEGRKGRFQLEGGYFFHFLQLSQKMNPFLDLQVSFGGAPVAEFLIDLQLNDTLKKAWGQRVKGRATFHMTDHWNASLFANYLYCWTQKGPFEVSQVSEALSPPAPPEQSSDKRLHLAKFWWHALWVTAECSFSY